MQNLSRQADEVTWKVFENLYTRKPRMIRVSRDYLSERIPCALPGHLYKISSSKLLEHPVIQIPSEWKMLQENITRDELFPCPHRYTVKFRFTRLVFWERKVLHFLTKHIPGDELGFIWLWVKEFLFYTNGTMWVVSNHFRVRLFFRGDQNCFICKV